MEGWSCVGVEGWGSCMGVEGWGGAAGALGGAEGPLGHAKGPLGQLTGKGGEGLSGQMTEKDSGGEAVEGDWVVVPPVEGDWVEGNVVFWHLTMPAPQPSTASAATASSLQHILSGAIGCCPRPGAGLGRARILRERVAPRVRQIRRRACCWKLPVCRLAARAGPSDVPCDSRESGVMVYVSRRSSARRYLAATLLR